MNMQLHSRSAEEYLEAIWLSEEGGEPLARINRIARWLAVSKPSVVEMLKKLEKYRYLSYHPRRGVRLTNKGKQRAKQIVRNHRLMEALMKNVLHLEIEEEAACGFEHYITKEFADKICTAMDHPRFCPHGKKIPHGQCCKT